jgi:hypothetical protein
VSKQIIILGTSQSATLFNVNVLMWFPITQFPKPGAPLSAWSGASAAENSAIQAGSIVEESNAFQFPLGFGAGNIKTFLQQYWTSRNAAIGGLGTNQYANVFYDSSSGWSA